MATQSKPQSFEDRNFFPGLRDCPDVYGLHGRSFRDVDPDDLDRPGVHRKHWCILGEIVQLDSFIDPDIVFKDYKGDKFTISLYVNNESDESEKTRLLKHFKVGNTMAIFYPQTEFFVRKPIGMRAKDSDKVLIMPLKMSEVVAMNKEVVKYTPADDDAPRKCHGCNEVKEKLGKCGGCGLFFYCNTGHKKFCKVLKDKNVRYMHFLNYGVHSGDITFS